MKAENSNSVPLVSVIVPCYNVEDCIEQCLLSIKQQTYRALEIICVNDGSTDGTERILQKNKEESKNFTIINQPNKGLSCARNSGLNKAKGDYVFFLDSDDFIKPRTLEILVAKAQQTLSDITISNIKLFYEDSQRYGYYRDEVLFLKASNQTFSIFEQPEFISVIGAWDRLYKTSFLRLHSLQFVPNLIYEDIPFTVASLLRAERISVVPEHLYIYRKGRKGAITTRETTEKKKVYRENFIDAHGRAIDMLARKTSLLFFFLTLSLTFAKMHLQFCESSKERKIFKKQLRALYSEPFALLPKMKEFISSYKWGGVNRYQSQIEFLETLYK